MSFNRLACLTLSVAGLLIACGPPQPARRTPVLVDGGDGRQDASRRLDSALAQVSIDANGGATGGTGGATGGTGGTFPDAGTPVLDSRAPDGPGATPPDATIGVDTTAAPDAVACEDLDPTDEVIVNFEDGQGKPATTNGRSSEGWFPFTDDAAKAVTVRYAAPTPPRCASRFASSLMGGPNQRYSGAYIVFVREGASARPYDVTPYKGVRLFLRSSGAASQKVRVNLVDRQTWSGGGVCKSCGRHFGKDVTVGPAWTRITVRWSELMQETPDDGDAFTAPDLKNAIRLELTVRRNDGYVIDVDDVAFVK